MNKSCKKWINVSAIISSLLLIIACGNKDSSPQEVYFIEAGLSCTEDLKEILDKDVHASIDCVKDSLDQFASSVKLKNPQYIERQELTSFLQRYFPESFDLANDLLKLIYDLNTLLFNDPTDQVSISNIPNLFKIAHLVNDHGRVIKSNMSDLDEVNYWQRRDKIFVEVQTFAENLETIISPFNFSSRKLNIISFIENLKISLDLSDEQIDIELITSSLFAKRMILGGDKKILTSTELNNLLQKASEIMILGLDILYYKGKAFINNEEQTYFYFDVVNELKGHLASFDSNDVLIEHKDITTIIRKIFEDDQYDLDLLEESLINLKEKILGGNYKDYKYSEINSLFSILREFTGLLYFTETTYNHYNKNLSSPNIITYLKKPNLKVHSVLSQKEIDHHWNIFYYITKNYRYFPDANGNILFDNSYHRTPEGFTSITLFRWGIDRLMNLYGENVKGENRKVATKERLNQIMQDAEGVLKEFIYWPKDYESFLGETITNADLFQFKSNGNDVADTDELTEYILTVLHSFDLSEKIHEVINKSCPIIDEELESFKVGCFRQQFYPTFFKALPLDQFYPELYKFNNKVGENKLRTYFKNIESYARLINDDGIPMNSEELARLIVIISSIEGIYIKFDYNKDGILSRRELDNAFKLFIGLIKGVIDLNDSTRLYHSIFLYIIKYMKEPSPAQLLWYHVFGDKKVTSTRFNIGSALSAFLGGS